MFHDMIESHINIVLVSITIKIYSLTITIFLITILLIIKGFNFSFSYRMHLFQTQSPTRGLLVTIYLWMKKLKTNRTKFWIKTLIVFIINSFYHLYLNNPNKHLVQLNVTVLHLWKNYTFFQSGENLLYHIYWRAGSKFRFSIYRRNTKEYIFQFTKEYFVNWKRFSFKNNTMCRILQWNTLSLWLWEQGKLIFALIYFLGIQGKLSLGYWYIGSISD